MVDWRKLFRSLGVALNLRDPPNVPPYGWSYFDHLAALYVTLNAADERADAVIKKSRETPDNLTWGDIFLLENLVFALQPPEVVQRSAWVLRERFREISSPQIYGKYVASTIPVEADTPAKVSLLRADLTRLLDLLHWYYSLIPIRERIRKTLTVCCMVMVTAYTAALGALLFWCHWHEKVTGHDVSALSVLAIVVYGGIVGGFVSSQRRMQNIPSDGDPLISVFGLDNAGYYLWLSPLLGSIFSVILTMMFVGGVLKGSVFPEFQNQTAAQGLTLFDFAWHTLPKSSEEYGKLFVWAFLAGFAERLVPDSLDRLSSRLDAKQQMPSPPSVGGAAEVLMEDPAKGLQRSAGVEEKPKKITPETVQDVIHSGENPPETLGQ